MSKNCTYKYYDSKGNLSTSYIDNSKKYGEEAARNIFITEALKGDMLSIRYSQTVNIQDELKQQVSHEVLSAKGYQGITSILKRSKGATFDENAMYANIAIGLKQSEGRMSRDEVIEYFKYDDKTKTASNNVQEFNAYFRDAKSLSEFRISKGDKVHKYLDILWKTRLELDKNDKSIHRVNVLWSKALQKYKETLPDKERLDDSVIRSINASALIILNKIESLVKDGTVNDYEVYPEVSLFSDKVMYDRAPLQGHVDMIIYSPSRNLAHIVDTKTMTNKKALQYSSAYSVKNAPFDTISDSPESDVRIQTSTYAILAKQQLGVNIGELLLFQLPVIETPSAETIGNRTWEVTGIDLSGEQVSLKSLQSLEGALYNVLDIKELNPLGEKNYENLTDLLFNGKLVTVKGSKEKFIDRFFAEATKTDDGKFLWNHPYDKTVKLIKDTEEELRDAIGDVYEEYVKKKRRATTDLIEIFKTGTFLKDSIWNSPIRQKQAIKILSRFKNTSHTIHTSNDIKGLGEDIVMMKNKGTGEISLISIALIYDEEYFFNEDNTDEASTTIYGPFLNDEAVTKKYGYGKIPKATSHNLNQLKLVMLASELRITDPENYSHIADIMTTCLLEEDDDNAFDIVKIEDVKGHVHQIHSIMEESGQIIPTEFTAISKAAPLLKSGAFDVDYFELFIEKIKNNIDPLSQYFKENPNAPKNKSVVDEVKASIDTYITDKYNLNLYPKLTKDMTKYIEALYSRLLLELKTPTAVYQDQRFIAANRAFLSFKNIMVSENPTFRGHVLGTINSLTTVGNRDAEKVHIIISQYEQQAREKILDRVREHVRLQDELMKKTPGVNKLTSIFHPDNFKKVFKPMLEDGYEFAEGNVENWMKFKDPDKLTGIHKEYVIFYNKMVKEAFGKLFGENKLKLAFPDTQTAAVIKKWKEGYIPILPTSASVDIKNVSNMRQGMEASVEMIKSLMTVSKRSTMSDNSSSLNPWEYSSFFPDQVDSGPGRGSKKTREFLKITEDNKMISDKRSIEMNPAVILNMLIVESARKEFMTAASFAVHAIQAELVYKDLYASIDTEELREIISNIANLRIHGKVKDQGRFGDYVDALKHTTSIAMFFGSLRQFFTESSTATFQLTSQSIANVINKHFFKGENSYDNKDMLWAVKHFGSDLGDQIVNLTGMFNSGVSAFLDDAFVSTRKNWLFQTKHGFYPIHLVLKQAVQSVTLAQMHKLGITEDCFNKDKNGVYRYNEAKDNRFYVYDPNLKIEGQKDKPPQSEEDIYKYKLWLGHRLQMAKEGGINIETGMMTKPFIVEELQSIKNQSIRLIGAMDNSETLAFEFAALGRAVGAYKKWIRQKVANYWTPKTKSFKMGKWKMVNDELKFIEEDFEGIINTIISLTKEIKNTSFSSALHGMSDIQKRNMSKLIADLLMMLIIALFAVALDDILEQSLIGREFAKGVKNATSDLIPVLALSNTITGSPAASLSIALNTANNAKRALFFAVTGEFDESMKAADKTMDISGVYRTTKSLLEIMTNFEPQK